MKEISNVACPKITLIENLKLEVIKAFEDHEAKNIIIEIDELIAPDMIVFSIFDKDKD